MKTNQEELIMRIKEAIADNRDVTISTNYIDGSGMLSKIQILNYTLTDNKLVLIDKEGGEYAAMYGRIVPDETGTVVLESAQATFSIDF